MNNALLFVYTQQPNNKQLSCNSLLVLLEYSHRRNEKVGLYVVAIALPVMYHSLCQKEETFQGCRGWHFIRARINARQKERYILML